MAHKVKCYYCGHIFDRDKEPYIEVPNQYRRYAHKTCQARAEQQMEHEQESLKELEDYIKKLFNYKALPERVNRQIREYTSKNGYTYSGILSALKYFFDVRHNTTEKANGGIGIVPYVYDQANLYWRDLWETKERNSHIEVKDYVLPVREIHISPPQRQPMKQTKRLFTFLIEEDSP